MLDEFTKIAICFALSSDVIAIIYISIMTIVYRKTKTERSWFLFVFSRFMKVYNFNSHSDEHKEVLKQRALLLLIINTAVFGMVLLNIFINLIVL